MQEIRLPHDIIAGLTMYNDNIPTAVSPPPWSTFASYPELAYITGHDFRNIVNDFKHTPQLSEEDKLESMPSIIDDVLLKCINLSFVRCEAPPENRVTLHDPEELLDIQEAAQ